MAQFFQRKSWIAGILVLAYLLIGGGFGHGLIWCQEADAFSHLEYNLSGNCQKTCPSGDFEGPPEARPDGLFCAGAENPDCLDSPVVLSHVATAKLKVPPPAVLLAARPDRLSWSASFPEVSPRRPARPNQPPPQALVALRTVVLLN